MNATRDAVDWRLASRDHAAAHLCVPFYLESLSLTATERFFRCVSTTKPIVNSTLFLDTSMPEQSKRSPSIERSDSGSDSNDDMPETSENPRQSSSDFDIQAVPKKRKRTSLQAPLSRWKRLRAHYNDKYRELYNETVNEVIQVPPLDRQKLLSPSQIGVTWWSSEEKETFFTTLAKRGRGDLPGIASAIGTKNELEVHVYLKLLQNAVVHQNLHNRLNSLFDVSAAPGALEVSLACSDALELSAEALCILQQRVEAKIEKRKHHDMCLLNRKLGRWASTCLSQGDQGEKKVRESLPAAELLDLEAFLKLSTKIFMNSSDQDKNWREYCARDEKPSIFFTAFGDFHRLVVSIARRLIQSSLFFAMSRRKASTTPNFTPKHAVRKQDVLAALNVLGMKHNSQKFWAGVAERCALRVYDDDDEHVEDIVHAPLSLSEVEKRLSQGEIHEEEDGSEGLDADDNYENDFKESSMSSAPSSRNDGNISSHTSDGSSGWASPASSGYSLCSPKVSNQYLDSYAESLDAKASSNEEKRLWELLDKQPPEPLNPDAIVVPRVPTGERKTGDDLDDWRAWTDYAPEWETYAETIPKASFTRSHRHSGRKEKERKLNAQGYVSGAENPKS